MGSSQSKSNDERIFENETPAQFSQGLVNHLADNLASSDVPPVRQSTLDARIRHRIDAQVSELKVKEAEIAQEIERAFEKETLPQSSSLQTVDGTVRSSLSLQNDLDEVRRKVDNYKTRRELSGVVEAKEKSQLMTECYRKHPQTPLDCWQEVANFKSAVASLEQQFVESFR